MPFATKFPSADPLSLDLLEKMLVFDPRTRISATEGLAHEYLAPYHDPTDEPVAAEVFDWSFNDADLPVDTWKVMMYSDILGTFTTTCMLLPADHQTSTTLATLLTTRPRAPSLVTWQRLLLPPKCLRV